MSERCTDGADDLRDREEAEMLERFYERKRAGEPCPTCDGGGEVPAFTLNVSTGEQKMTGTMKCWECFGTGKKEERDDTTHSLR